MTQLSVLGLLLATGLAPVPTTAQIQSNVAASDSAISAAVERGAPAAIALRHQIHQHPELGNREFETSKLVANRLRPLGLDVQTGIAHTGVIGILKGGQSGPVVAVRSELDALQVTEDSPYPFKSTVRTTVNGEDVGVAMPVVMTSISHQFWALQECLLPCGSNCPVRCFSFFSRRRRGRLRGKRAVHS